MKRWCITRLLAALLLALLGGCLLGTPLPATTPTAAPTPAAPTFTPDPAYTHSPAHFQVFILSPVTVCVAANDFMSGNVCHGPKCGDCSCSPEDFDPPAPLTAIPPSQLEIPPYNTYSFRECFNVTLEEAEITDIARDMMAIRDMTYVWTGYALDLQLEIKTIPHTHTGFVAPDFVFGPFEVDDELLNPYVTTETDFIYVITGYQDKEKQKELAGWCGGAYGEYLVHGAGYAYIQYNPGCASVVLGREPVYEPLVHEWLHNLDWALYYLNGVPDRYQNAGPDWEHWDHATWPACQRGAPAPLAWFPSVDLCEWDPDWIDCNNTASAGRCIHAGEVNDADSWYEHVLSIHYPRSLLFNGNACRDGRRDFGETALDLGGSCP